VLSFQSFDYQKFDGDYSIMNIRKTALASAIALAITGTAWAETTTVGVEAILDRTTVNAGGTVNMAVLGLTVTGETDITGELGGSQIQAIINTTTCDINGGCSTPDCSEETAAEEAVSQAAGQFAATINYLNLIEGKGRVYLECPADITEETKETVKVTLQELLPDGSTKAIGIPKSYDVTITPSSDTDPEKLAVMAFVPAESDTHGKKDCFLTEDDCDTAADGISGAMTAGQSGGQIVVWDANPNATGTVTVTLKGPSSSDAPQEYSYTAEMSNGEATATLDGQITTAGDYYIAATMTVGEDTLSSVDLIYSDMVKVWSTGVPTQLTLAATKQRIANPDFTKEPFADELIKQGTEVTAQLLDEYGNATSHCNPTIDDTGTATCTTGGELTVKVEDSNGVVNPAALNLMVPANDADGDTDAKTGNDSLGDENGELLLVGASGTASLVATVYDSAGNSSTIAASDPLEIQVVPTSLTAELLPGFSADQMAGAEFDAFEVNVINDSGQRHVDTNNNPVTPGKLVVTNMATGESGPAFNPDVDNDVRARFLQETNGNNQYIISDQEGQYAQILIEASAIIGAAATQVKLQNAHGDEITDIPPGTLTTDKKYYTLIPEVAIQLFDDYGNEVTGEQPLTSDDTGQFTAESSNAAAILYNTPEVTYGIPGRFIADAGNFLPSLIAAEYEATGTNQFAGQDAITVNSFTKPGLANQELTVTTTIPAFSGVTDIVTFIEAPENTVPVNSEFAISVEVQNSEGEVFIDPDPTAQVNVTLTINGQEGDTITPKPLTEVSWTSYTLTQTDCDTISGEFDTASQICITADALTDSQCQAIADANNNDNIMLRNGQCMAFVETPLTSGQTVDFNATDGRKVIMVGAGATDGQFSLVFTSVDDTTVTTTRTLNVGKVVPAACEPGSTNEALMCSNEEQCQAAFGVWTGSCQGGELMTAVDANEPDYQELGGSAAFGGGVLDTSLSAEESAFVQEITSLSINSEVKISGVIKVDDRHLGYPASLVVGVLHYNPVLYLPVTGYEYQWYFLEGCDTSVLGISNNCAVWGWDIALWDFEPATGMPKLFDLESFSTVDALGEYYQLNFYSGNLSSGLWGIYYGYVVTGGPYQGSLIYNGNGILINVE
jgi:hypothetical protein